jgi:hypothetical protein
MKFSSMMNVAWNQLQLKGGQIPQVYVFTRRYYRVKLEFGEQCQMILQIFTTFWVVFGIVCRSARFGTKKNITYCFKISPLCTASKCTSNDSVYLLQAGENVTVICESAFFASEKNEDDFRSSVQSKAVSSSTSYGIFKFKTVF